MRQAAVNFAHGDLVMAGGYVAVGLGAMAPLPMIVLLPLVAAIMFALGVAVSLVAYFPLMQPAAFDRLHQHVVDAASCCRTCFSCCSGRRRTQRRR